jgi:hypothetical protein
MDLITQHQTGMVRAQIAQALEYAHERGVVGSDITLNAPK